MEKYKARRCKIRGSREKIFKKEEMTGWLGTIHNENYNNSTSCQILLGVIKLGTTARHVACKGRKRNTQIFWGRMMEGHCLEDVGIRWKMI
jgi:hypothetical protein